MIPKSYFNYSVFQSAEVQKLWVLGKRQEAKGKGEEKQVYLTSLGNAINASTNTQIGCHFLHVNEQGELETVLREIKTQDSPHADCVEAWRFCLAQKNIDINRKKIDKLWIQNYIREDTPSQNEKRDPKKYCNLSHALTKKDIWNFEHEVLNELKEFLQLFAV
ncbi:MAG: hypothetical protein DWQ51_15410 [Microcystis wesenbergii TW10]|jgi:hypothetical protein|uniref:Uncharacterized protein n=1 Tax=Microcystis wesenbergii TW10 TaxID=2060474 RepID=A0A3E0LTD2_9CHRO|nr:MAG: hypothetical protein DWQ51_15410 [Microcystis wesenbergii TW10]